MHARIHRRALALILATLGMVAGATLIPAPAQAQGQPLCSITYRAVGWNAGPTYPAGFQAEFVLKNNSTTRTASWRVDVRYQAGVEVTQHWNSVLILDADPVYAFGNTSWNFGIAPNGETSFGVVARKSANGISNNPISAVCTPTF